jgi:formylglycine-generating enzyme required for sulfatase activity
MKITDNGNRPSRLAAWAAAIVYDKSMVERSINGSSLEAYQQNDASIAEFFSVVPSGDFLMGSDDGQDEEQPPHRVYISGFDIGIFPVRKTETIESSSIPAVVQLRRFGSIRISVILINLL